jgi:hypothetical protein
MKYLFVFIAISGLCLTSHAQPKSEMKRPPRLDLVQVEIKDISQVKVLDNTGFIINQVRDGYVVGEASPTLIENLSHQGYEITLLQEDISGVYFNNFMSKDSRGRYLTYTEYIDTMNVMATNNPTICKLETLGYSYQNRLVLAMKISDSVNLDENEPAVYFDGNTHGDEKIGWAVCYEFIKYLLMNYNWDPIVTNLINNREIWVVPMINPDGYVNNVRYNGHNVDLNRNYGWMWGNESQCGSDACSESEVMSFINLFLKHPFAIYTTYHAGDSIISYPWSYTDYDTAPEKFLLNYLSAGYSSRDNHYPYGQGSVVMYYINGSSKDLVFGFGGEMGWSIELCNTKTPPASNIDSKFNINREAMLWLCHKAGQGIQGSVYDSLTGQPLFAQIWVQNRNWLSYTSPTNGDFHRFYLPGTYNLIFKCLGYKDDTVPVVVPNTGDSTVYLNVAMVRDSNNLLNYGMRVMSTRYVTISSNRTYPTRALGLHDSIGFSVDNTKWIVIQMSEPILNMIGNDFTVFRSSGSGTAAVKVSNNWKGPWTTVGTANAARTSFDISASGLDTARYVRLDATGTFGLDAIEKYYLISGIENSSDNLLSMQDLKIKVYPSIATNYLKISSSHSLYKDIIFTVYDITGRNVKTFSLSKGEKQTIINLKNLQSGVYFIKTGNGFMTDRFVKAK